MRKLNIIKEQVGQVVKTGLKLALGALVISKTYFTKANVVTVKRYIGEANYSDAVDAIVSSSMFDSSKNKALDLLKRDGDVEYYRSVIATVTSDMFDSSKIQTIKTLSEK